jgi:diacylglycerol kinase (ATP)
MTAKVILNPYSNRWKAEKRWVEAADALRAAGVKFDLAVSDRPRQISELAEKAVRDGFSPIIAAGGDGTIGEVVNGLARAAKSPDEAFGPMGILPLGSANDLVLNLGMPLDLRQAAQVIAANHTRLMDLGQVNGLYGVPRYIVAALRGIMDNPHWNMKITWDDGEYEGPSLLVTVGNGARTGGLFMSPHADLFDGKLTFVYGYRKTRGEILSIFPRTMKPGAGNYVEAEGIHEQNATWIKIHLESPAAAHVDGEIFSTAIQDLEYRVLCAQDAYGIFPVFFSASRKAMRGMYSVPSRPRTEVCSMAARRSSAEAWALGR